MYSMFVAVMAFFARISNPLFGGTNMTLLNTLTNLGTAWANTAALWLTDFLTYKQCSNNPTNTCSTDAGTTVSKKFVLLFNNIALKKVIFKYITTYLFYFDKYNLPNIRI